MKPLYRGFIVANLLGLIGFAICTRWCSNMDASEKASNWNADAHWCNEKATLHEEKWRNFPL